MHRKLKSSLRSQFFHSFRFFQPSEAAFIYPTLGHHLESMQFTTLGDVHCHVLTQDILYARLEGLTDIDLKASSNSLMRH